MNSMFFNCQSIVNIDFKSFKKSCVYNLESMFYNCKSLIYINLSSLRLIGKPFDQYSLRQMFYNCTSLTYLNINSLEIKDKTNIDQMLHGCLNLAEICFDKILFQKIAKSFPYYCAHGNNNKEILYQYFLKKIL